MQSRALNMADENNEIVKYVFGAPVIAAVIAFLARALFGSSVKSLDDMKKAQETQAKAQAEQADALRKEIALGSEKMAQRLEAIVTAVTSQTLKQALTDQKVATLEGIVGEMRKQEQDNREERHRVAQLQAEAIGKLAVATREMLRERKGNE